MDRETETALERSIKHWTRLQHGAGDEHEGIDGEDCDLCQLFADEIGCEGCPVSDSTGQGDCEGTHWRNAHVARLRIGILSDEFKGHAHLMTEFLKSLREE